MKKIVLLCAQGMSTGVIVAKMRVAAEELGYECTINSYPVGKVKSIKDEADVILIGPQVRFEKDSVVKVCPNIPVQVIDMAIYGQLDGKRILKMAKELIEKEKV